MEAKATQPTTVGDPTPSIKAISANANALESSAALPSVLKDMAILVKGAAALALGAVTETIAARALFSLKLAHTRVRAVLTALEALVALARQLDAYLRVELASREPATVAATKVPETPAD